jgi:hypothetical protein
MFDINLKTEFAPYESNEDFDRNYTATRALNLGDCRTNHRHIQIMII